MKKKLLKFAMLVLCVFLSTASLAKAPLWATSQFWAATAQTVNAPLMYAAEETNVAKVGTTEYSDFAEALAAWGPGKTLELLADVTTTSTFTVNIKRTDSNWTLNLNDYTWTANGCDAIILHAYGGTPIDQNVGLIINANENGGITAAGKNVIKYTYESDNSSISKGYRAVLKINGGTYTGSKVVYVNNASYYSSGPIGCNLIINAYNGNVPVFNGNLDLGKTHLVINSGVFNGTVKSYVVTSTSDTEIKGGKFASLPTRGNDKKVTYGSGVFYYTSDKYYEYKSKSNPYEAKVSSSFLATSYNVLTDGFYTDGYVYFEEADDAINNSKFTTVTLYAASSQDKTVSSGTFTLEATDEDAVYSGNVTLSKATATFVLKAKNLETAFTGNVTTTVAGKSIANAVAGPDENGVYTVTYSVSNPVAQIGTSGYGTLAEAFAAAQADDVVEVLVAGTYKLDGIPSNITLKGNVSGVVIYCVGSGSIVTKLTATFDNLTMQFGSAEYHGFQHAGQLVYTNCIIEGYYKTYGPTRFEDCTFNQETYAYSLNAYGTDLDLIRCTFNNVGKGMYVYNEGNTTPFTVNVTDCIFNVNYEGQTKSKAQIFVKNNYANQKYTVNISGCTLNATGDSHIDDPDLTNGQGDVRLWNVEEGTNGPVNETVFVTLNGTPVYPVVPVANVAKIGDVEYETLAEAVAAVQDGETITMIADVEDASGISVPSGLNFTIDFNDHVYTLGGNGAGSAGTKTIGFQLLQNSTITFKNGTINCSEENKDRTWASGATEKGIAMLIQNYANLTLDNMVIDGTNIAHNGDNTRYILSNNSGNVAIQNGTSITAPEGDVAFDACQSDSYTTPNVTVNTTGTITGIVELTGGNLSVVAGTFTDEIPADNVAEGCIELALKNAGGENLGKYVVAEYPQAFVNKLGEPYQATGIEDELNVAYSFNAFSNADMSIVNKLDPTDLMNPEQMAGKLTEGELQRAQQVLAMMSPYLDYNADFVVSFDQPVDADAFLLAGQYYNNEYGENWLEVEPSLKGYNGSIEEPIRLLEGLFTLNYAAICTQVIQFNCGARALDPEAMAGKTMTVELRLYETDANVETGNYYSIGSYEYTFPDVQPDVAQIGDVKYKSLADAVAAAQNGDVIVMIADETIVGNEGVTIPAGLTVTLDLNGFTIKNAVTASAASQVILNKGTLTITDFSEEGDGMITNSASEEVEAGTWPTNNYFTNLITNNGTLTINGGTLYQNAAGSICYAIDNYPGATATINGGHLYNWYTNAIRQYCNSTTNDNIVTINGGLVEGYYPIWMQNPNSNANKGTLNINGGTINTTLEDGSTEIYNGTSPNMYINITGGTINDGIFEYANLTVSGGTINGNITANGNISISGDPVINGEILGYTGYYLGTAKNVSISGGTFTSDIVLYDYYGNGETTSVTGGKFDGDLYLIYKNENWYYTEAISGGLFASNEYEYEGETYDCDWLNCLAEGYEVIDNPDDETKEAYPYAVDINPSYFNLIETFADGYVKYTKAESGDEITLCDIDEQHGNIVSVEVSEEVENVTVNYVRNYEHENWQAICLPFDVTITADMLAQFAFDKIWDTQLQDDGAVIIETVAKGEGKVMPANTPFEIKAINYLGNLTLTAENTTLHKTSDLRTVECSTVDDDYRFNGFYTQLTGEVMLPNYYWALNKNGNFSHAKTNAALILPYRFYLQIVNKWTGKAISQPTAEIKVRHMDEFDDPTAISNVNVDNNNADSVYDLSGRKIGAPQKGMNIINGKKVLVK